LSRQCMWRDSVFLSRHADRRDQKGVTPMHVARQRVFVTPRRPARPKGLDLQIYIQVGYF